MMNQEAWEIADAIARSLQDTKTDVNELKKVIAYLRWSIRQQMQSDLFEYLRVLATSGEQRSNTTVDHYRNIQRACEAHLQREIQPEVAIEILGWAARLKVYYKDAR
jgi:hypothetical protein